MSVGHIELNQIEEMLRH